MSPRSLLALVFLLLVGGAGAWVPFLALHLERTGRSGPAIGLVLALMPVTRILASPVWGAVSDRWRAGAAVLRLTTLASVGFAAAVAFLPLSTAAIAVALAGFAFVKAPMGPLLDTAAVRTLVDAGADPRDYGKVRLWGSVGFLACAAAGSALVDGAATAAPALALATCAWALGGALTFALPDAEGGGPAPIGPALRALGRSPFLAPFLVGLGLHGVGLAVYDLMLPVHTDHLGLGGGWTAAALTAGVAAEVAVMAWGRPILARFGAPALLVAAGAVGAARWAALAVVADPVLLVALQVLHGPSFGAFWIAAVEWMRARAPAEVQASAQALLPATAYGVGPLLAAGATATLLDRLGTAGLFGVGALAGAGATACFVLAVRRERSVSAPG